MGGQQSTRRLTVNNEHSENIIHVSETVLERLRGGQEVPVNTSTSETSMPNATNASSEYSATYTMPTFSSQEPPRSMESMSPVITPGNPFNLFEPTPTSLQLRKDKEAALRKNDQYWQGRINKLEEKHQEINKVMDKEYSSAVREVIGNEESGVKRHVPCQKDKKAVLNCYKKYPNEPMRCAKEVLAFANCVDKQRIEVVAQADKISNPKS